MKLKHIIDAKDAVVRLSEKRFNNYKKAREVACLRKAVEAKFDAYCEQEKKAIAIYGELTEAGTPLFLPNGMIKLKDETAKAAFDQEMAKLLEAEVTDFAIITLSARDFLAPCEIPTPSDMLLLENVINFED